MKDSELLNLDMEMYVDLTDAEKYEPEQLEKDPLVIKGKEIVSKIYKKKKLYNLRYFKKKALEAIKKDLKQNRAKIV